MDNQNQQKKRPKSGRFFIAEIPLKLHRIDFKAFSIFKAINLSNKILTLKNAVIFYSVAGIFKKCPMPKILSTNFSAKKFSVFEYDNLLPIEIF